MIVDNLLENAVKYSSSEDSIEVILSNNHSELIVEVADHGIGIKDVDKIKVTERFYRGDDTEIRKKKGTGLGLYIVKRLIEKLNGTLQISDNQPNGTIIKVKLPVSD